MNNIESLDLTENNLPSSSLDLNKNQELNAELSSLNNQILFIDSTVENYQILIDNLIESTEFIILDKQQDGIFQITEALSQYDSLDAVHIVSHGKNGELFLGNTALNQDSLSKYENDLNHWNNFIEVEGDILLYGCNIARDLSGVEFVGKLSEYTQADIQASDDLTGSSELNGDWDLEYATGKIETELIFNNNIQTSYDHALYVPDFDINIVIDDFVFNNPDSFIADSINIDDFSTIQDLAFNFNELIYVDDTSLKINTDSPNYGGSNDYYRERADESSGKFNALLYGFTTESLNFDYNTFDFSSVSSDSNSITFGFNQGFNIDELTTHQSIKFNFFDANELRDGAFKYTEDTIDLGMLSFNAEAVTFTSSSVSFEYDASSLNFNPDLFVENSNLFDYKLLDSDKVSFTESDFTFDNFNASDYKALEYAFVGDELFDPQHYIDYGAAPIGTNPFTHYMESGYKLGLNPNSLFDVNYYLNNNPDVKNEGKEPLSHYTEVGYSENHENRDPNALFDTSYYNENNPDVFEQSVNTLAHYMIFGNDENHENRDPNQFFDNSYYNANNPDVAADSMTALEHWMNFGYKESRPENPNFNPNRNPHPFLNASDYYIYNDDVRIASYELPSANPNQHLLEFGIGEKRVTHKIFNSDSVVKVTKSITANDESFPKVKTVLDKAGVKATPTEDGQIELANIFIDEDGSFNILEPVEDITDTIIVGGLTFTFIAGATIKSAFETALENVDWQLVLEQGFGGFVNDPFFIAPFGVPTNIPAFPEFRESPTEVEIFQPEDIEGIEDIEFIPLENMELPNVLKTPLRDEFLEELLNNGLFLGGEQNPQGIYFYASGVTVQNPDEADFEKEIPQAIRLGELEGGGSIRFSEVNKSQGIEGYFKSIGQTKEKPFSLKGASDVGKKANLNQIVNDNSKQIQSAGITEPVILRVEVPQFGTEELKNFFEGDVMERIGKEGVFEKIYFDAEDGVVLVDPTGVSIIK